MGIFCVLLTDGARAKIYRSSAATLAADSLDIIYDFLNFQGRQSSGGDYPSRLDSAQREDFAREICRLLSGECRKGNFDHLILVGPAAFLGSINTYLAEECRARLCKAVERNDISGDKQALLEWLGDIQLPSS